MTILKSVLESTVVLGLVMLATHVQAQTVSPFSGIPISAECQAEYQDGMQLIERKMRQGFPFADHLRKLKLFEDYLNKQSEACRFFSSLGLHDAITYMKQQTLAELAFEHAEHLEADAPLELVQQLYRERITAIGEDPAMIDRFVADQELMASTRLNIRARLNATADNNNEAVPFGRFVFLGHDAVERTLYDFAVDNYGAFKYDGNGQLLLQPGSYQRLARAHFERTKQHVQEYLDWRPGIFFGKDSFWRGSFWRYFSKNPEPGVREVKEEGYFNTMRLMLNSAERLRLDTEPYREMYKLMLEKQRALLARDLHAYDTLDKYKWAALFVPVGMYVGGAAMAATGWLAAVPSGSTGVYLGGSLAYAANVSGLISLSVIGGYATYGGYHVYNNYQAARRDGRAFRLTDAMDIMALATIQSFPLAAVAPVIVGGSMYAGQTAFISGRSLLLRTISLGKQMGQLGFSGTMRQLGTYAIQLPGKVIRLPQFVFRKWLEAWYKNPKLLLTHYGVDIAFTVLYDCGYRQLRMNGESKCYFHNEAGNIRMNEQFLYSLGGTVITGPLSKPIALIKNFGLRWASYRAFSVFSSTLIQLTISGEINRDRLLFDEVYFGTFGTGSGEVSRSFKLSQFVTSKSVPTQALLIILFKALIEKPITTPLYVNMQSRFLNGELRPVSEIKKLVNDWALIDISDFSDADVKSALEQLQLDSEFVEKLQRQPEDGPEEDF